MSLQTVPDLSDTVVLESNLGLYLKPVSRIKINVQIPKLSNPGQSISSWHVMEKLKTTVKPDAFLYLKALKITSAVIKFEGELETKAACERALARLRAAGTVKINGFTEKLLVRAAHSVASGPTRHDWEAFFRDAKGGNEMKPGERPDTIHLQELPVRWFCEGKKNGGVNEKLVRMAFGTFGKVRRLEVPSKAEVEGNTIGKTSLLHRDSLFEAYVQYEEYVEFAIAMDSLRGKKLLYKESNGKVYAADIKVDFDRTRYLSEACIKKREVEERKLNPTTSIEKEKETQDNLYSSKEEKQEFPEQLQQTLPTLQVSDSLEHSSKVLESKGKLKEVNVVLKDKEKALSEAKLLLKELLLKAEVTKRQNEKKRKLDEELKELTCQKKLKEFSSKETNKHSKVVEEKHSKELEKDLTNYSDEEHGQRKFFEKVHRGEKRFFSEEKKFRNDSERKHHEKRIKTEIQKKDDKKKLSHSDDKRNKEKSSKSAEDKFRERSQKHSDKYNERELHSDKTTKYNKSDSNNKKHKEKDTPTNYDKTLKGYDTIHHDSKHKGKVTESHHDKVSKDNMSVGSHDKRHKECTIVGNNKILEKKIENPKEEKSEVEQEVELDEKKEKLRMYIEEQKIKERLIQAYNQKKRNEAKLLEQERILKAKLLRNLNARQLKEREKLRKELSGRKVLKSVLGGTNSLSPL